MVSMAALESASVLLGTGTGCTAETLCTQTLSIAGDITEKLLTPEEAAESRDALAKFLYSKLFDWLVKKLNVVMNQKVKGAGDGSDDDEEEEQGGDSAKTAQSSDFVAAPDLDGALNPLIIGVLDIFGFEIFEHNTFEQLCINFTNEKLQQVFNRAVFKEEAEACKEQGIEPPNSLGFSDNQDVLDLMEKKPVGLMLMLDEEVRVVRGSDEAYLRKIFKTHLKTSKRLLDQKKGYKTKRTEFWIRHFAGDVKYDVTGFWRRTETLWLKFEDTGRELQENFISTTLLKKDDPASDNVVAASSGRSAGAVGKGSNQRNSHSSRSNYDLL